MVERISWIARVFLAATIGGILFVGFRSVFTSLGFTQAGAGLDVWPCFAGLLIGAFVSTRWR
jgi:hypothetical protein